MRIMLRVLIQRGVTAVPAMLGILKMAQNALVREVSHKAC